MSFGINLAGSVAAVSAECDKRVEHESPHLVATKEYVKKVLEGAPADMVVTVEASGHHDYGERACYNGAYVDVRLRAMHVLPEPITAEEKAQADGSGD